MASSPALSAGRASRRAARLAAACGLAALAVLAAGCSVTGTPRGTGAAAQDVPAEAPQPAADEAATLATVRYANGLRDLAPRDLAAERRRAEQALDAAWSPEEALRLALLLATTGKSARDTEHAKALLRRVARGGGAHETGEAAAQPELARFVLALVSQPRRARPAAAGQRNTDSLTREVEALRRALAAERMRRGELEQQVRALKELEQNINERPNGLE
jgi:hypothetical protein